MILFRLLVLNTLNHVAVSNHDAHYKIATLILSKRNSSKRNTRIIKRNPHISSSIDTTGDGDAGLVTVMQVPKHLVENQWKQKRAKTLTSAVGTRVAVLLDVVLFGFLCHVMSSSDHPLVLSKGTLILLNRNTRIIKKELIKKEHSYYQKEHSYYLLNRNSSKRNPSASLYHLCCGCVSKV